MRLSFGYHLTEYLCKNHSINKLKLNQILALIVTFFVYVVYHTCRRSISIVKPELNENCTESQIEDFSNDQSNNSNSHWCDWAPFDQSNAVQMLAWLDSSYLISYAVFMFVSGYVAERCDLRYFLTISLIICGIFNILFGIAYYLKIHNYYYFIAIQVLTGVAQTTGWPAVVAVVGNWFGKSKKGLIFGIWSWHTSVGNIFGSAVAGAFVESDWGLSFIVPGIIAIGMAFFVFAFLIPGPQYVGLSLEDSQMPDNKQTTHSETEDYNNSDNTAISFFGALKLPGVIEFSICLFFAKLVAYTFLYWLPEIINQTIKESPSKSAYLSIAFDIGGAVGAMLAGFIADKTESSAITCIGFLCSAIPTLLIFYKWGSVSLVSNQCLQLIAGMFVNGPYSLITTAVSADLGTKIQSKSALATVSAIIDGTGSIGAAVGPSLAGYLEHFGWDYVFYMVMFADFLAALSLIRTGINEFRRLRSQRKEKQKIRFNYKL